MEAAVNTACSVAEGEAECKINDTAVVPLSQSRLVCVEFPGLVNNVDKMLETIGGEQGMSRVITHHINHQFIFSYA